MMFKKIYCTIKYVKSYNRHETSQFLPFESNKKKVQKGGMQNINIKLITNSQIFIEVVPKTIDGIKIQLIAFFVVKAQNNDENKTYQ